MNRIHDFSFGDFFAAADDVVFWFHAWLVLGVDLDALELALLCDLPPELGHDDGLADGIETGIRPALEPRDLEKSDDFFGDGW